MNNDLLDTYQLKSLDAVLEAPLELIQIVKDEEKKFRVRTALDQKTADNNSLLSGFDNFAMREPYDRVIRCLGFKFNGSLFGRFFFNLWSELII